MGFGNLREKLDVSVPDGPQTNCLCAKNIELWQKKELQAYKKGIGISNFLPERRGMLTKVQWWQRMIDENPGMAAEDIDKLAEEIWQSKQPDLMDWDMCAVARYVNWFRGSYTDLFREALKEEYARISQNIDNNRRK